MYALVLPPIWLTPTSAAPAIPLPAPTPTLSVKACCWLLASTATPLTDVVALSRSGSGTLMLLVVPVVVLSVPVRLVGSVTVLAVVPPATLNAPPLA